MISTSLGAYHVLSSTHETPHPEIIIEIQIPLQHLVVNCARLSQLFFHHQTTTAIMTTQQGAISKRRKFVADGVFYAELNEFFQRELAEEGYSGVEVRVTPTVTDISMQNSPKGTQRQDELKQPSNSIFPS